MSSQKWRRFYSYQMTFAAVDQNVSSGNVVMQVTDDAPFFITSMQGEVSDGAGNVVDATGSTLNLVDNGSSYPLFFAPIPFSTVVGTGALPFFLPVPYPIRPNSSMTGQVFNGGAVGPTTYTLTFSGYKLFGADASDMASGNG